MRFEWRVFCFAWVIGSVLCSVSASSESQRRSFDKVLAVVDGQMITQRDVARRVWYMLLDDESKDPQSVDVLSPAVVTKVLESLVLERMVMTDMPPKPSWRERQRSAASQIVSKLMMRAHRIDMKPVWTMPMTEAEFLEQYFLRTYMQRVVYEEQQARIEDIRKRHNVTYYIR